MRKKVYVLSARYYYYYFIIRVKTKSVGHPNQVSSLMYNKYVFTSVLNCTITNVNIQKILSAMNGNARHPRDQNNNGNLLNLVLIRCCRIVF